MLALQVRRGSTLAVKRAHNHPTAMPDGRPTPVPLDFDKLTRNQQRLVRKLTWETLKAEAPYIVVIPSVISGLGAVVGLVAGVILGRLAFFNHQFYCALICLVAGTGIGIWIGRRWMETEFRPHFKGIIRDHEREISQIT